MAGEPELAPGVSGDWVTYLQQLLNHHYQQSVVAENGEFDDAVERVVQHLQQQNGLSPTGVVDARIWTLLTDGTPSPQEHHEQQQQHSAQPQQQPHQDDGAGMHPTGAHAHQVPATFSQGGMPAFRYNLPEIPIATAVVDTGAALIEVELTMTGSCTVTFPHGAQGATVTEAGLSLSAAQALDGLTNGLTVSGLGSAEPSISAAIGSQFLQVSASPLDPNTIQFTGSCHVDYQVPTEHGDAQVTGTVGYRLKITITPHTVREEVPVYDTAPQWVDNHNTDLLAVGAVVLLAAFAIAAAPETGGASLLLLGV